MAGSPINDEFASVFPEILAPAGDPFKLKTALAYGADAVYLAGDRFGLRQAADNFLSEELRQGCAHAHSLGKQVYVTLNAFLFDDELKDVPAFLEELEDVGVDAVIVSDLGVFQTVKRLSNLNIHISTQASTLNTYSAAFWKRMGAKRIVLGREVSIEEAILIRREAGIEVELFIHGAMCMAYSGHCTISNYTAGRDSNRGGCVQSCRFSYSLSEPGDPASFNESSATTFISSKDLRSIDLIPLLMESPIDSLKIEGRNKSQLYVATVVRNYARAKKQAMAQAVIQCDSYREDLEKMSFRGFTEASLREKAGRSSVYQHEISQTSGYCMLGTVVDKRDGEYLAIHLRSEFQVDDLIEVMAYDGMDIALPTHPIWDGSGNRISSGKPNSVVFLPDHDAVSVGMILRKKTNGGISC